MGTLVESIFVNVPVHTDRFLGASHLLLRQAILDAENGVVREYFAEQVRWEAALRQVFGDLASVLRGRGDGEDAALSALRQLNGSYRTRFKSDHLPLLRDALLRVVRESDWLLTNPPRLLDGGDEQTRRIADVVPQVLTRTREFGTKRPYSLVSKFLHFCFPDTFVIFDSQAARSIQMWSIFAFDESAKEEKKAASRFNETELADSSGKRYFEILEFYRWIWTSSHPDDRALLESKASEMQEQMREATGQRGACVTAIDLIDKLLWLANGNPIRLGLAVPPSAKGLTRIIQARSASERKG